MATHAGKQHDKIVGTAVVLGASMAGLAAARVLADHCRRVVLIDRDTLPEVPTPRRLVPQGRHPHLLLPSGARLLEAWFPGLGRELLDAGAVEVDLCADFAWYQRGGLQRRPNSGLRAPAMSRPLLGASTSVPTTRVPTGVPPRCSTTRPPSGSPMLLPLEGNRWIVAAAGVNGESAPTDGVGLLDYLGGLEASLIADELRRCEPLGDTVTHRFPANQRRHIERMRRFPDGWVLLGDALCSFDPIYGQGMSSAALQAEALGRALDRARRIDRRFARSYFRAAAKIVNAPWSIAVGGDFAYEGTKGTKPVGTDLLNRYFDRVVDAGRCDDAVVVRLNEVIALVRSPQALFAPSFVLRVLRAARRVDRAGDHAEARVPQLMGT